MDITPMTVVRVFLVLGGSALAGIGLVNMNWIHVGVGIIAFSLGTYRLWSQYRE